MKTWYYTISNEDIEKNTDTKLTLFYGWEIVILSNYPIIPVTD